MQHHKKKTICTSPVNVNEHNNISEPKQKSGGGSFYFRCVPVLLRKSTRFHHLVCITERHFSPVLVCQCGTERRATVCEFSSEALALKHPCPDLVFSSKIMLLISACLSTNKINTFYKTQASVSNIQAAVSASHLPVHCFKSFPVT